MTRPRAAFVKEYKATHPHANIKWVLYDGDSNGSGTLQSKFALYNRVGWKAGVAPDVVFDEENYEAGWLGEPPFNDLLNLAQYIPKKVWSKDEGLGDCLINGKLLCLRNDNAANVLWVNTQLWSQFFPGQSPPTTWQQYAADGQSLVKNHPGYFIGEFGQPWDAETYLWGNECPINRGHRQSEASGQPRLQELHDDREADRLGTAGFHARRSVHVGVGQGLDRPAHGHGHRRDLARRRDLSVGHQFRRARHQRDGGLSAACGDQWRSRHRLDRWWPMDG